MASLELPKYCSTIIFLSFTTFALFTPALCVNIALDSVSELLKQSALDSLNNNSPTGNTYKNGNLLRAAKLVKPPYQIYRLELNLEPRCIEGSSCLREVCAINLRQHELGAIDVEPDSIRCMRLYPQSNQAEMQQETTQDEGQNSSDAVEQDTMETFENRNEDSSLQLDHEVQTVADGNERPFIAVRATERNYCAGCPYELNPTLPGLTAYCEQVVQSMDDTGHSDFKHKVIRIARVTRAVPPGSNVVLYELLLEIGETNCLRISSSARGDCSLLPNVAIKLCLVTFEQRPWQRDSQKIVRNNCTDLPNSYDAQTDRSGEPSVTGDALSVSETNSGQEAQSPSSYPSSIDGFLGNTQKPPTSNNEPNTRRPVVEETATKSVVETNNAKANDVQGFQDKYKEFDEFLDGIDFYKPISHSDPLPIDDRTPVQEEIIRPTIVDRTKTDGQLQATSTDDEHNVQRTRRSLSMTLENERKKVRLLAQKVIDELDDIDADNKKRKLLAVTEWTKQSGSGTTYHITMIIADRLCDGGTNDCLDHTYGKEKICKARVHMADAKSPDTAEVLQSNCSVPRETGNLENLEEKKLDRARRSGRRVGASTWIDPNDPKIQQYVRETLSKYSETFSQNHKPYLVEVVNSTQQIVSGTLNKIIIRVGESTCSKDVEESCQLKSDSPIKDYEVTVWSQPWLDHGHPKIEIKVYSDKKEVSKRSLHGKYYNAKMLKISKILEQEKVFERYIADYGKTYKSEEEKNYRFTVFQDNLERMKELRKNEQGTGIYGANMFADLTPDEFRSRHLGLRPDLRSDNDIPLLKAEIPNIELPEEFDWRRKNVITEVKDQGSCGSCWAFSVTGNVEALNAIKHGKLVSLSEQELVDCDKMDSGCNGGLPDTAYRALEQIGGLELETDYPYDGKDEKCHFDKKKARVQVISGLNITSNETQMAQWLVQNGPISIGINANAMQFYMGGISHPFKFLCNGDNLDHGVLIVGYGIHTYPIFKKSMPYWIIKNSWGPRWGEHGYYRVYRGDGTCGLNRMATSAVIA